MIFGSNHIPLSMTGEISKYFEVHKWSFFDVLDLKNDQNAENDVIFLDFVINRIWGHSNKVFLTLLRVPLVSMGHLYTDKQKNAIFEIRPQTPHGDPNFRLSCFFLFVFIICFCLGLNLNYNHFSPCYDAMSTKTLFWPTVHSGPKG